MVRRTALAVTVLAAAWALPTPGAGAGAFPGDNGRMAFVSNRDGNAEIYTSAPEGSDARRLTTTPGAESSPAFSPVGSRIAFARVGDIWVMAADGGNAKPLTGSEGSGEDSPAWSRDGTRLAFVSNRGTTGGGTTGPELWVMDADGSDVRQLTDTATGASHAPAWSPAADQIAFHSNLDGEYEIYTIDANATPGAGTDSRVKLTDNVGLHDQNPSWSPDGNRIVFERGTGTAVGDATKDLWTMDANGANQAALTTTSTVYDAEPAWSPDGTRIAFESNADGDLEIHSMPAGGGAAANLTDTTSGIDDRRPDWGKATPPPPPPPPPAQPQPSLPPPVAGKSVNAMPRSGAVKIKLPGTKKFVVLAKGQQIPVGTIIDTTKGRVTLVAASNKSGGTSTAVFYDGIFKVGQSKGSKPLTTLTLVEKLSCGGGKASTAAKKKKKRRLWGDGKGRFRTKGKHSAATVVGTKWLVEDRCDSTLTRVVRGKVSVRDFVKRKTVIVRAGKKYVAKRRK